MAYTKQTWQTGDIITAQKLNHMEDGIAQGGGYDLVFERVQENAEDIVLTCHGISIAEIKQKIQNKEEVKVFYSDYQLYTGTESTHRYEENRSIQIRYESIEGETESESLYIYFGNNSIDINITQNNVLVGGEESYTYTYDSATKEYTFTYLGS